LNRTFSTPTNNKIWTLSTWLKRGVLGATYAPVFGGGSSGANYTAMWFTSSDTLTIFAYNSATSYQLTTTQVFRDPSAWYHVIIAVDTTQATSSNRVKLYVNGSQVTAFGTATYPSLNYNDNINSAAAHYFAQFSPALGSNYFDGYLTEVNFIDGQALTPSSFGSTNALTGVWQPARYTGTYGTNGVYLPFTDNSALTTSSNVGLGKDFSGNGNYWTTNNISITAGVTYDSMTDVPTLTSATAANFCVVNPLNQVGATIAGGNLNLTFTAGTSGATATFGMPSGKWYWETTIQQIGSSCGIGIVNDAGAGQLGSGSGYGQGANSWVYREDGNKRTNSSSSAYGASYTTGDVIGVAFDADADTLTFYKNGTSQGTAFTGLTATTYYPVFGASIAVNNIQNVNFGQRPFAYTPPTGYVALNTFNLPTSTIVKGNTVMDAVTRNGFGTSGGSITSLNFKPDFWWEKSRNNAFNHQLIDSVRGVTKTLNSNLTDAETTQANYLTSFNSNGYTMGVNDYGTSVTLVDWVWSAGGGSSSSNTSGTITSTVSVNASAGFSVVNWTPTNGVQTVGHGLGVAPALIIAKPRGGATAWPVYHSSIGAAQVIFLNLTNAQTASSSFWNDTSPTSSVFTANNWFYGAGDVIAYCWTPIAGYSAFGSYTGNGSSDGTFVYTGMRPRYILLKRIDSAIAWIVYDTVRNTYNVTNSVLQPNVSTAEVSAVDIDVLSNGFKLRTTDAAGNASGGTYIYMAFAENPFKNALAR
jgi:hypothetical protein